MITHSILATALDTRSNATVGQMVVMAASPRPSCRPNPSVSSWGDMRLTGLICAVRGHRWAADDESTGEVVHLHCTRCQAEETMSPEMLEAESWDGATWMRMVRSSSITWPNDDRD